MVLSLYSSLFLSPTPSSFRVVCSGGSLPSNFKFILHHAVDSSGIVTTHAKDARKGFLVQIKKFNEIERQTSIAINQRVDLWKTALFIAAEDDSLVSQSSVPLPVDSFVERLYDLSMDFSSCYSSSLSSSPETFLHSLDRYMYFDRGFNRSNEANQSDPRVLYLPSVLTHGSGSAAMLSLIYSEILKVLRMWRILDFDFEIFFPRDCFSLPKGYHKQKSVESDQPHIITTQKLLEEILRNLKETFWPFQHDYSKSSFLRAAEAANFVNKSITVGSSRFQLATAAAAQRMPDPGVWTSAHSGDMRLALSACERLILLDSDPKELRDYSILLYHCGFYNQSLQYLKLYKEREREREGIYSLQKVSSDKHSNLEEETVKKLMTRLTLISMEEGWRKPSHP